MKDYPSFPSVFRAGSATSVNLLQSSPSNRVTVSNFSEGNPVGCAKTGAKKFQDAPAPAEINNCMSYRNNSMSSFLLDPRQRNTVAGAGRCSGLDNDTAMDYSNIPEPPTTDAVAHMKYLQSNAGLESDLNSSFNSLNESTLPPPTRSACTRTTTNERNSYLLWVITPVAASISVAIVVAALAGPQWLYTEERVPNNSYSGVPIFDLENDEAFVTKYTKSSLWILCYTFQGMKSYNCVKIDCFPEEQYRPDPQDSTLAIPYTIVKSAPFFLVSGGFLLISFIVFLLAACTHQNSLYYFTSGILFIVSGLLMLIGLIAYISIFKAEIGSKLRPKSTLQPPPLKFTYGHSFFMYVFGFVSTEFVGVLNIFLFISLQQVGHHKTIPCLSFMNNQDKVKDLEKSSSLKRLHQKDEEMSNFVCKKHPLPTNLLYTNDIERRYYFEKPPPCGIHSKDVAKSLNELYTEPAPTFSLYELPQEFPLTRSVSTATEIYSNKVNGSNNTIDTNPSAAHQFEMNNRKCHVATNNSKESINDICGLSRGLLAKNRKTKDELFNEFCKRAGDRPKPKDIYFIEDNGNQDEDNIFIVDNYATLTKNRRSSFREPRKRNTTSTLPPFDKIYPKSLFDLDRCDSEIWNNCPDQYFMKNKSQDGEFYQSRTLPRCFMKRNFESSGSGINRSSTTDFGTSKSMFSSNGMLHKSTDEINFLNYPPRKVSNTLSVQWPATIPTSPSTFSTKSSFRCNPANQPGIHKMKHRFTFEDQRSDIFDSFDLDEIERERRKSHASLFDLGYDIMNGTAV